jgi:phosphoglycolate phosphatase
MARTTIVFDLDGTLVDTAPDLIDTLNIILGREGMAPVPYEQGRVSIGGGARAMISRGLAAEGRQVSPAELDKMFVDFIAHYSAHIADRSRQPVAAGRLEPGRFRLHRAANFRLPARLRHFTL